MSKHRFVRAALLAPLVLAAGVAAGGEDTKEKKAPVYKSPQAVYSAARKAAAKEDWKTLCGCLTDDSRDMMAGGMVMMPLFVKGMVAAFAKGKPDVAKKMAAQFKPLDDVLTKHGLTPAVLDKMKKAKKPDPKDPESQKKAMKRLVAPIKDRCAFIADMAAALKKMPGAGPGKPPISGELKDVKVSDDSASGVEVQTVGGKEVRRTIKFRKVGRSWKMELPPPPPSGGPPKGPAKVKPGTVKE